MTRSSFFRLAAAAAAVRPVFSQDETRSRRWREDLQFLVAELKRLHPDPFFRSPQTDFESAVAELDQRIPELADHEVIVAFSRLLAMLGDGHTSVVMFPTGPGLRQYPLRLQWFPEGLYAVRAGAGTLGALGGRLIQIGSTPIDEAWEMARPLISADNEWAVRAAMPSVLISPEALHALRLIPMIGPTEYTFALATSGTVTVSAPISGSLTHSWPRLARPVRLLYQQDPGLNYWFDYIEAAKTLYIKYNACATDPMLPMPEFAREIGLFLSRQRVERIVIDVRNNGGGDSALLNPVLAALGEAIERGFLLPAVRGFCIIGRQTASSAMWNAIDLKANGVTLVGEPTGGKPNAPGLVQGIRLPNSLIAVNISTRMWSRFPAIGDAEALPPDLPVHFSVEDYRAERDPFLEKVLE